MKVPAFPEGGNPEIEAVAGKSVEEVSMRRNKVPEESTPTG